MSKMDAEGRNENGAINRKSHHHSESNSKVMSSVKGELVWRRYVGLRSIYLHYESSLMNASHRVSDLIVKSTRA